MDKGEKGRLLTSSVGKPSVCDPSASRGFSANALGTLALGTRMEVLLGRSRRRREPPWAEACGVITIVILGVWRGRQIRRAQRRVPRRRRVGAVGPAAGAVAHTRDIDEAIAFCSADTLTTENGFTVFALEGGVPMLREAVRRDGRGAARCATVRHLGWHGGGPGKLPISGFESQNSKIKSADSGFQAKLAEYLFI
ncbi:hypothetical protein C8J57DRAFT_1681051 [Mycena rebaudengoi]|nr:hypothetical protein C8J57DRAFT_1681051 [Mycena rebaudengoi]